MLGHKPYTNMFFQSVVPSNEECNLVCSDYGSQCHQAGSFKFRNFEKVWFDLKDTTE